MLLRKLIFGSVIYLSQFSLAQGFKLHYSSSIADCFGAIEVLDYDNDSRVQFPGNYGVLDDFDLMFPDFHEVNSVWLRLEPRLEGTFGFDIYTENNVDFAYLLFKGDNSFCERLEANQVEPLQKELHSYHSKGISSNPDGGNYKPSIQTKFDDVFYLMIHTNSTYQGKVRVNYTRTGTVEKTHSVIQDFRAVKEDGRVVRVRIRDAETQEPVEANMIVKGLQKDEYLFMGTDFLFDANLDQELHFESNTQGYFLFSMSVSTDDLHDKDVDILIELQKLAPGKKLALEEIKFEEDSDVFLQASMPALKRLLDFLALNDAIRVLIQGHVNAPGDPNTGRVQNLSEIRAKAVKKYLKDNGIAAERMETIGLGNTMPKYPNPTKIAEEEANRRVEIEIIE